MTGTDNTRFGKWDAVVIASVVLVALAMILFLFIFNGQSQPSTAQIWKDQVMLYELPLQTDTEITVTGEYSNTITVRDGRIAITAADCPGEDCVHTGWIDQSGYSIVCLPNRVEIRLTGEPSVDAIVH